jgi:tape measure domain-containing protein
MAAAGQMAEFFATFGFKIKEGDIKRIDKQLNYLEARARRMSEESLSNIRVNISRFSFQAGFDTRLKKALEAKMKLASTGAAPIIAINDFKVSKAALRAVLLSEAKLVEIKLDNFKVSTVSLRAALKAGFASKSLIPPLVVKDIRVNRVSISNSIREAILKSAKPILRIDDFLVNRTAIAAALREATRTLVLPKVTLPLDRFKVSRAALTKALRDAVVAQKVAVPLNSFRVNRPALTKAIREALLSPAVGKIALTIRVFKIKKAALLKSIRETLRALPITAIEINRFDVDREALLREMRAAIRYAESNLRFRIRSDILPPRGPAGGFGGNGGGGRFGAGLGAGAAAGNLGRGFIPGLGVAFGVSQLNKINQELVGQQYAAQAVFGSPEKGQEGLAWLRDFSNEVGQDYRQQGQPYIRMIASATNAGMEVAPTQDMYAGISRYGRTMGLGTDDMKGSMRAVEQMLNKQQIYAEELKTQLAEKMPGVISAMAEAVTGETNNTKELFKLMETGNVSAMQYLPEFARILEERAMAGGAYEDAIKASTAEQGRFNNVFSDMVKVLSAAGFEEGQQGLFRTMATFLKKSQPLVQAFGEAWAYIGAVIRIPLGLIADLSTGIDKLSEHTGMARGNILALGGVITLLALPFTRFATGVLMALAGLEDFTAFMAGRDSLMGQALGDSADEVRDNLMGVFESLYDLIDTIVERVEDLFDLFNKNTDFKLIDWLNEKIKALQDRIETFILLFGGDTLKVRTLERELDEEKDPDKKEVIAGKLKTARALGSDYEGNLVNHLFGGKSLTETFVNFVRNDPRMMIPNALGVDNLVENMSQIGQGQAEGVYRHSSDTFMKKPTGFSEQENSGAKFNIENINVYETSSARETAQQVTEDLLKSSADKFGGALQ